MSIFKRRFIEWLEHTFVSPTAPPAERTKTIAFAIGFLIITSSMIVWLIPMIGLGVHPHQQKNP
jgi:hypothetical protein